MGTGSIWQKDRILYPPTRKLSVRVYNRSMKRKLFVLSMCAVALLSFFALNKLAHASLTRTPFGGRVVSTVVPDVTCAGGTGPITIIPSRPTYPPAAYYIPAGTRTGRSVKTSSWILGYYSITPNETYCQIETPAGPAPFPVLVIKLYGASK